MTIEKFDREKAQAHLDSHVDAVVIVDDHRRLDFCYYTYGKTVHDDWQEMRLGYITDTPPQAAEQMKPREATWGHRTTPVVGVPTQPFRITGPGRYREREGGTAEVWKRAPSGAWVGLNSGGKLTHWEEDGFFSKIKYHYEDDLVARIPDEPEQPEDLNRSNSTPLKPVTYQDGWIPWHGGECPVRYGTLVDVRYRDGRTKLSLPALEDAEDSRDAEARFWEHDEFPSDIIAYRLHVTPEDRLTQLERRIEALEQIVNGGK
jgi:hypothetical protein